MSGTKPIYLNGNIEVLLAPPDALTPRNWSTDLWLTDGVVTARNNNAIVSANAKVSAADIEETRRQLLDAGYLRLGEVPLDALRQHFRWALQPPAMDVALSLGNQISMCLSGGSVSYFDDQPDAYNRVALAGACVIFAYGEKMPEWMPERLTYNAKDYLEKLVCYVERATTDGTLSAAAGSALLEDACALLTITGLPALVAHAEQLRMQRVVQAVQAVQAVNGRTLAPPGRHPACRL